MIHGTHCRHWAIEFKKFLSAIDKAVPQELDVHLVLDNASSHKIPANYNWLLRHPRFHLHFTLTSSSWLNLVERWVCRAHEPVAEKRNAAGVRALEASLKEWVGTWNENPRPYVWYKTADGILETLAAYCERIPDSGH